MSHYIHHPRCRQCNVSFHSDGIDIDLNTASSVPNGWGSSFVRLLATSSHPTPSLTHYNIRPATRKLNVMNGHHG
jgi:hypothetical protein